MMANSVIKRPALGQVASLGNLYDARSDSFISLSMLKSSPPDATLKIIDKHSTDIKLIRKDTYEEKFDNLGVNAELSASVLAGLASVEGSGRYLTDKRDSNLVMQASMQYAVTTVDEDLNITATELKDCLAFQALGADVATHVVTGISWGAQCVITAKTYVSSADDKKQIAGNLDAQFGVLKMIGLRTKGEAQLSKASDEQAVDHTFEVTVYGDVLANDGLVPTDFNSARSFVCNVHRYITAANGGKGKPLAYTLMPLNLLSMINMLELKADIKIRELSVECLEKFVQLFDELREAEQNLYDYYNRVREFSFCVPASHIQAVADQLAKVKGLEATLKSDYAKVLKKVRADSADAQELWQLLAAYRDTESAPKKLVSIIRFAEKMDFAESVIAKGAQYLGFHASSLDTALTNNPHDDAYILFFNGHVRRHCNKWNENYALLLELLEDKVQKKLILVVDYDAFDQTLENSCISQTRNRRMIVEDVLEQRKQMAKNCTMRHSESHLDRSVEEKPIQRRAVKIPCPSLYCDRHLRCNWICFRCNTIIEYGFVNDLLYCDCGACPYNEWEFKCNDIKHGSGWNTYSNKHLLQLLKALESFQELNILILGKTGVGKSTWINAFINYLTFETLDDALAAEDLKWIIPCSFSTTFKDTKDKSGRILQKDIIIGSSKSEHDGTGGNSATQCATVYAVDIGETRVRLIDTPGIGDTRGVDQDNRNMVDILNILRNYNNLHGIMILLKPNEARLDVMFKFCIKQLLTHLHRSAAKNIVFGFTNSRSSNYGPGDTFKPLQVLLEDHKSLNIGLFDHNVYCFDSESFRYLAAQKKGLDMGRVEENRLSWENSVKESKKLIDHFRSQKPHQVRSTLNLNETRHMIEQLSEPMARLTTQIHATIATNEDEIQALRTKQLTRDQLQAKLYVTIDGLATEPVDYPRTVCTHAACVEAWSGLDGRDGTAVIHRTICHSPCSLTRVGVNVKGHPDLAYCAAMINGELCGCSHHWKDHMHIYYEYRNTTTRKIDKQTEQSLSAKTSDIDFRQRLIDGRNDLIKELNLEYQQIQDAAIQFGFFLKRHAITPYNDATLEYIDHQIDEEKENIKGEGMTEKLERLKCYRKEHQEKVAAVEKAISAGKKGGLLRDDGVKRLIDDLYHMKHYGEMLHDIIKKNEKGRQRTYREKSCNIHTGSHWTGGANGRIDDHWEDVGQTGSFPGFLPGSFPATDLGSYSTPDAQMKKQATKASGPRPRKLNRPPPTELVAGQQNPSMISRAAKFIGF